MKKGFILKCFKERKNTLNTQTKMFAGSHPDR